MKVSEVLQTVKEKYDKTWSLVNLLLHVQIIEMGTENLRHSIRSKGSVFSMKNPFLYPWELEYTEGQEHDIVELHPYWHHKFTINILTVYVFA